MLYKIRNRARVYGHTMWPGRKNDGERRRIKRAERQKVRKEISNGS